MPNTIRDLIQEKAGKLRDVDVLGPNEVAKELVELSSLLSSVNKLCGDRRYWLGLKKVELLKEHQSAARANVYAEGTTEFRDWLEAEEQRKAIIEMVRSIKYYLRTQEIELKEARY